MKEITKLEPFKITDQTKQKLRKRSFLYNFIALSVILLLMIMFAFSYKMQDSDSSIILKIQAWFPSEMYDNSFFLFCTTIIRYYTEFNVLNGAFILLYNAFHPFILFKIGLLANLSVLFHTIAILLIYTEPRPYWIFPEVKTVDCNATFTGPSYNQFMATLVIFYTITMVRKSQVIAGRIEEKIVIGVLILMNALTLIFSVLNAENFIYQNILGIIIAVIIVIITNIWDKQVSMLALKVGFFIRASKQYKFLLLVVTLLIFSTTLAFCCGMDSSVVIKHEWIKNYMVFFQITKTKKLARLSKNSNRNNWGV